MLVDRVFGGAMQAVFEELSALDIPDAKLALLQLLACSIHVKHVSADGQHVEHFLKTCGAHPKTYTDTAVAMLQKLSDVMQEDADAYLLCDVCEWLLGGCKTSGSYYTPKYAADFIVKRTLNSLVSSVSAQSLRCLRIIDPAAGAGVFLLSAIRYLQDNFTAQGLQTPVEDACRCVHALDIDPLAVEAARLAVWVFTGCTVSFDKISQNIRCADSLFEDWGEHYDAIIGNPPYLFGENLPGAVRAMRERFRFARGQCDAYWLYYELALDRYLKPGGCHGYIVPDAILARDEVECIRREICGQFRLISVTRADKVFGNAAVSSAIVIWKKEPAGASSTIEFGELTQGTYTSINTVYHSTINCIPGCKWLTGADERTLRGIIRLLSTGVPLGKLARISRGEELGKRHLSAKVSDGMIPILAGDDLIKLGRSFPSRYIDPSKIKKPLILGPRILLLKTGRDIVASVDLQDTHTLQSVYNITDIRCDIWFLCGYLCSVPIQNLCRTLFTDQKKLFPQLNQSSVAAIPILLPEPNDPEAQKLHRQISDTAKRARTCPPDELIRHQKRIDTITQKYLSKILTQI